MLGSVSSLLMKWKDPESLTT